MDRHLTAEESIGRVSRPEGVASALKWGYSSVGQSVGLQNRRSWVRSLLPLPRCTENSLWFSVYNTIMDVKQCGTCKLHKPLTEYNWRNKSKGTYRSECRNCTRAYDNKNYTRRKPSYRSERLEYRNRRKLQYVTWIVDYFLENPCVVCGESDPLLLDFDHRNQDDKSYEVADLLNSISSWSKIQNEIIKCDVLCVSCHRRKTATQCGWWMVDVLKEKGLWK